MVKEHLKQSIFVRTDTKEKRAMNEDLIINIVLHVLIIHKKERNTYIPCI